MKKPPLFTNTFRIVVLCSLANFINSADRLILSKGFISSTNNSGLSLLGYFASQLLGYFWATKVGTKNVLMFSVLLWSCTLVVTPLLVRNLLILATVIQFADGLGISTIFHLFANRIPKEQTSRAFSYVLASGYMGQSVAVFLYPRLTWEAIFCWFGSFGILWYILCSYLHLEDSNEFFLPIHMPDSTNRNIEWTQLVLSKHLWAIYSAHFAMNLTSYIIMQWSPIYLSRFLGGDPYSFSFTAVPYIVNSIFGMLSGHVADELCGRKNWSTLKVRRLMTTIGLIGPTLVLVIFCAVDHLTFAVTLVSISMGLSASNYAGHLSNHVDVAPNCAGITFGISNLIATIPGFICGRISNSLAQFSYTQWLLVFIGTAFLNLISTLIYFGNTTVRQIL